MGREGFEPSKAEPTDLQSVPFDHSGTSPNKMENGLKKPLRHQTAIPEEQPPTGGPIPPKDLLPTCQFRWSWQRDSNPRPADYKSAALPTELRQPSK